MDQRLSLCALELAYGRDTASSGPLYESMRIEGGAVRLRFLHAEGGLSSIGGGKLTGFAIAGADNPVFSLTNGAGLPALRQGNTSVSAPIVSLR